ncbi:unnamed protein product [Rodentolepis nana]|uniref:Uncharacterized protein n=1 Tax=Rodentolepis nana TaxID=102285 RepID=A0A0R3T4H8_RODNA|nr:unnamed protein product [Rodentolepis nana]
MDAVTQRIRCQFSYYIPDLEERDLFTIHDCSICIGNLRVKASLFTLTTNVATNAVASVSSLAQAAASDACQRDQVVTFQT